MQKRARYATGVFRPVRCAVRAVAKMCMSTTVDTITPKFTRLGEDMSDPNAVGGKEPEDIEDMGWGPCQQQ